MIVVERRKPMHLLWKVHTSLDQTALTSQSIESEHVIKRTACALLERGIGMERRNICHRQKRRIWIEPAWLRQWEQPLNEIMGHLQALGVPRPDVVDGPSSGIPRCTKIESDK